MSFDSFVEQVRKDFDATVAEAVEAQKSQTEDVVEVSSEEDAVARILSAAKSADGPVMVVIATCEEDVKEAVALTAKLREVA